MARNRIKVDGSEVTRLFKNLKDTKKILSRSMNRTIRGVKTDAGKPISKESGAQIKYVRKVLRIKLAKPTKLRAVLFGTGRRLPVTAFNARQTKKGITFRTKNGARKLIEGAFIQKTPTQNNYRGVWKRKYDKTKRATGKDYKGRPRYNRLPLRKLLAVSVGHVLMSEPVLSSVHRNVDKRWHKAVKQEIQRQLNGN